MIGKAQVEEALALMEQLDEAAAFSPYAEEAELVFDAARAWVNQQITDEMVERAAKAIYDQWWGDAAKVGERDAIGRRRTGDYMTMFGDEARAALEAALTRGDTDG